MRTRLKSSVKPFFPYDVDSRRVPLSVIIHEENFYQSEIIYLQRLERISRRLVGVVWKQGFMEKICQITTHHS